MSLALASAAPLKPQLRLAQAISEFAAALDAPTKVRFEGLKRQGAPEALDVWRLAKEVNETTGRTGGVRCLGPRVTNVLQSVQQFSCVVDVGVGASGNLVAGGVWGVVKLCLQVAIGVTSFFEKLTELFMEIGRDSPRYERLALLFPQSQTLEKYLCEYFITICQVCKEAVKICQRGGLMQVTVTAFKPFESQFGKYRDDLALKAKLIYAEVRTLSEEAEKKERGEQSKFRSSLAKLSSRTAQELQLAREWRRTKAICQLLDGCSTYNFETAWKRMLKKGTTKWIFDDPAYLQWKSAANSSSLWCRGYLGSGKTVLAANIVDDLIPKESETTWSYFFCLHDEVDSLNATVIIGSLARQLFSQCQSNMSDKWVNQIGTHLDVPKITNLLLELLPTAARQHYIVLDGLDECEPKEIETCVEFLKQLLDSNGIFKILWTSRPDISLTALQNHQVGENKLSLNEDSQKRNTEISDYIETELEKRLESDTLKIRTDPQIIFQIQDKLVEQAHGMFLWVALQLDSLCQERTDKRLLAALEDLPRGLPDTYNRILQKIENADQDDSYDFKTIFEIIVAARRPLTVQEMEEAIAIKIGDTSWDPMEMKIEIGDILRQFRSLLVVDEEDLTIRFTHDSAKKHIISHPMHYAVDTTEADLRLGSICVTYLNSSRFETQVTKFEQHQSKPSVDYVSQIVQNTFSAYPGANKLAVKLLKSRKTAKIDIPGQMKAIYESSQSTRGSENEHAFLAYARRYWLLHTKHVSKQHPEVYKLWLRLVEGRVRLGDFPFSQDLVNLIWNRWPESPDPPEWNSAEEKLLDWIANNEHATLMSFLFERHAFVDVESSNDSVVRDRDILKHQQFFLQVHHNPIGLLLKDLDEDLVLAVAVVANATKLVRSTLSAGAGSKVFIECMGGSGLFFGEKLYTAMNYACAFGMTDMIRLFLESRINLNSNEGISPLEAAVENEQSKVAALLLENGADVNVRRAYTRHNLLHMAVMIGDVNTAETLLEHGIDVNEKSGAGEWPLLMAAGPFKDCPKNALQITQLLINKDADLNAKTEEGDTVLHLICQFENEGLIKFMELLVKNGARVNARNNEENTPLYKLCIQVNPNPKMVESLLKLGADVNIGNGAKETTALQAACRHGNGDVVKILLDRGADIFVPGGEYGTALEATKLCEEKLPAHAARISKLLQKRLDKGLVRAVSPVRPIQ